MMPFRFLEGEVNLVISAITKLGISFDKSIVVILFIHHYLASQRTTQQGLSHVSTLVDIGGAGRYY